jgi:hypothetical protein
MWEVEVGGPRSEAILDKSKPYLKNKLKQKGLGNVVEVVENLPNKHNALSLHPTTAPNE